MELVGQKQLEIQYLVFEVFESDGFLRIILCMPHVNLLLVADTSPWIGVTPPKQLKELKGWVCLSSVLGDPESEKIHLIYLAWN